MKKLNPERKKFLINKSLKEERRKRKRKNLNIRVGISAIRFHLMQNPQFYEIDGPENLTLKYEDSNKVLKFIKKIKKYANKGYYIDLKLENTKIINEGAIALLLSVISDLERRRIFFKGTKPKNNKANDILERSGFFKHMNGSISKKNRVSNNKILTTGKISTHQKTLVPEIHKAMETIWGVKARCPALYGGLGEMVRNSCDHAFQNANSTIWHWGITHLENDNTCKFSFVDNGSGILKTNNSKGVLRKLSKYFDDNADILETAFRDGIESRTGLSWRGKGLPTIFEMYDDNIITNLVVITNDVYLDFDRKISKKINTSFSGTYYFWRIDKNCNPSYFELKK
ncbi:MAG: hypothetical protein JKY22_06330 [Flavobacteriaceae bacterium]|nr:hypothetical protein [Flavobacteriaceae bacterium]